MLGTTGASLVEKVKSEAGLKLQILDILKKCIEEKSESLGLPSKVEEAGKKKGARDLFSILSGNDGLPPYPDTYPETGISKNLAFLFSCDVSQFPQTNSFLGAAGRLHV